MPKLAVIEQPYYHMMSVLPSTCPAGIEDPDGLTGLGTTACRAVGPTDVLYSEYTRFADRPCRDAYTGTQDVPKMPGLVFDSVDTVYTKFQPAELPLDYEYLHQNQTIVAPNATVDRSIQLTVRRGQDSRPTTDLVGVPFRQYGDGPLLATDTSTGLRDGAFVANRSKLANENTRLDSTVVMPSVVSDFGPYGVPTRGLRMDS